MVWVRAGVTRSEVVRASARALDAEVTSKEVNEPEGTGRGGGGGGRWVRMGLFRESLYEAKGDTLDEQRGE